MDVDSVVRLGLLLFLSILPDPMEATTESYVALKNDLFNRSVIKHKIPPGRGASGQRSVAMHFAPFQILRVDEIHQFVSLSAIVTLFWYSSEMGWDPDDYGGINFIYVDADKVWTPQISLPKSADSRINLDKPMSVRIGPNYFTATIPTEFTYTCELDLTFFPFDSHNCSMLFIEMQMYSLEPQKVIPMRFESYFSTTTEWVFGESSCTAVKPEENLVYTECWITLKRRSLFYILGVFVPILIIALMTHFVFLIPVESGEKVSYIVSLFVSMTIFINYVISIVPRSMNRTPRIVVLVGSILFTMVVCMFATFIVIRCYHRDVERQQRLAEIRERDRKNRKQADTNVTSLSSRADSNDEPSDKSLFYSRPDSVTTRFPTKPHGNNKVHSTQGNHDDFLGKDFCNGGNHSTGTNQPSDSTSYTSRSSIAKWVCNWFSNGKTYRSLDNWFFVITLTISFTLYSFIITF